MLLPATLTAVTPPANLRCLANLAAPVEEALADLRRGEVGDLVEENIRDKRPGLRLGLLPGLKCGPSLAPCSSETVRTRRGEIATRSIDAASASYLAAARSSSSRSRLVCLVSRKPVAWCSLIFCCA